jgi:hypothetical protein
MHGLGVLNLDESAAVVPIPVFGKQLSEEPFALADVTNTNTHDVPAISVTKPPAPQPINLPSVNDVVPLPSPPDSNRSSVDVDLEAGRGVQRLVNDNITSRPPVPKVTPPAAASNDDMSPVEPSPTGEEDTDLLADATPLEAALSPSLSVEPERAAVVNVAESSTALSSAEEDVLADTTIRLVGGGPSFSMDLTALNAAEEAIYSGISVTVVAESGESSSKKEQPHDKTKSSSLSSFKRLSAHLASGKRKKDSVGSNSVKEAL